MNRMTKGKKKKWIHTREIKLNKIKRNESNWASSEIDFLNRHRCSLSLWNSNVIVFSHPLKIYNVINKVHISLLLLPWKADILIDSLKWTSTTKMKHLIWMSSLAHICTSLSRRSYSSFSFSFVFLCVSFNLLHSSVDAIFECALRYRHQISSFHSYLFRSFFVTNFAAKHASRHRREQKSEKMKRKLLIKISYWCKAKSKLEIFEEYRQADSANFETETTDLSDKYVFLL